jgi:hypothetical protein
MLEGQSDQDEDGLANAGLGRATCRKLKPVLSVRMELVSRKGFENHICGQLFVA